MQILTLPSVMLLLSGCSTVAVELMTLPAAEIAVEATPPQEPPPEPVRLTKIELRQQIRFSTWRARILPESYPVLDEVAKTLEEHPEIALVEIQGHTARTNKPKRTQRLSERRARAVKRYLVERGIAPDRLVDKGYGESEPIADNDTAEGRQKNRRVEFVVKEQEGAVDQVASVSGGAR